MTTDAKRYKRYRFNSDQMRSNEIKSGRQHEGTVGREVLHIRQKINTEINIEISILKTKRMRMLVVHRR